MIPQTAIAFLAFILLVVPGISFELLRQTRRPSFEQTALEELARVVLASVAFTSAAGFILAIFGTFVDGMVIKPEPLASRGLGWYWSHHPKAVVATVFLELAIATTLALLIHRSLNHPQGRGIAAWTVRRVAKWLRHEPGEQVERFPVWRTLFRDLRPRGADTKLTVLKKDGTLITGLLAAYSSTGSGDDREIALSEPIEILRPGYKHPRQLIGGWKIIMVSSAEISEVFVTWPPKGTTVSVPKTEG